TVRDTNHIISSIGHRAIQNNGDTSSLRVGKWTEYYTNGLIKATGTYEIGTYVDCCIYGQCRKYYSYKVGSWTYYHTTGQEKAQGTYSLKKQKLRTRCKGGDYILRHRITPTWTFWDENGHEIRPPKEWIVELEEINVRQHALAASRPRRGDNPRGSDDTLVNEQDQERRPAASAGALACTQT